MKRAQPMQDIPVAVQALTEETLEDLGINNLRITSLRCHRSPQAAVGSREHDHIRGLVDYTQPYHRGRCRPGAECCVLS